MKYPGLSGFALVVSQCLFLAACDDSGGPAAPAHGPPPAEPFARSFQEGNRLVLEYGGGHDTIRVALDEQWGGGIVELSLNGLNFANAYDPGREVQISLYDGDDYYDDCAACTERWGWNPVQAGDRHGHGSEVLDRRLSPDGLYIKTQPNHWSPATNGGWWGTSKPSDIVVEQWVAPVPGHMRAIRLSYRITHLGDDHHAYTGQQEVPALYANREFERLVHYDGARPWTGDLVSESHLPRLFVEDQVRAGATEWWTAYVDRKNIGLMLFAPGSFPFMHSGVQNGTTGPLGSGAVYTHPYTPFAVDAREVIEADLYLLMGDYRESRQAVYAIRDDIVIRDVAAPIMEIESTTPGPAGGIEIRGWAYDNVAVSEVELLAGGRQVTTARLGQLRPMVSREWPGAPPNTGFRFDLQPGTLPAVETELSIRAKDASGNRVELPVSLAPTGS